MTQQITTQETPCEDVHVLAQALIREGFLPESFTIDAHDTRPLWDFYGLCALLNQRPAQLLEIRKSNGPVYDRHAGIPSSWRMLIEP
jgi:hypothetical protein